MMHGGDKFYGYVCSDAGGVFAKGIVAFDRDHSHGDTGVRAYDTTVVVQGAVSEQREFVVHGHSIREVFSSSSSCSYSSPMPSRALSVACASFSSILDMAKPTWIRTQSPTSILSSS